MLSKGQNRLHVPVGRDDGKATLRIVAEVQAGLAIGRRQGRQIQDALKALKYPLRIVFLLAMPTLGSNSRAERDILSSSGGLGYCHGISGGVSGRQHRFSFFLTRKSS